MARTSGEGRLRWQQRGEDIVPRAQAGSTGLGRDEGRCLANCRHLTPFPYSGTRSSCVTAVKVLVCFHLLPVASANLAAPVLQLPGAGGLRCPAASALCPRGWLESSPFLSEKPRAGVFHRLGFAPLQKLPGHSRSSE